MGYLVREKDINKRIAFYNYLHEKYNIKDYIFSKEEIINSFFPFLVNMESKKVSICNSITVCACASQCKKIISINEFKNQMKGSV